MDTFLDILVHSPVRVNKFQMGGVPLKLIQSPTQIQHLSQFQLQSVELLQMGAAELTAYLQELVLNNPMVELAEAPPEPYEPPPRPRLLEDHQNRFYRYGEEESDFLSSVGTEGGLEETLFCTLSRQIQQLELDEDTAELVRYLAACLDDTGYFTVPLEELTQETGVPLPLLERGLDILRTLDPPGVGAADLSQCLALQLERLGETGTALAIVRDYLEPLAKGHCRFIALQLCVPVKTVQEAAERIQTLHPRPGAAFNRLEAVPYLLPDVFVEELDGHFVAHTRWEGRPAFRISRRYRDLLAQSEDRELRAYLTPKLRQAENILQAVGQRENTLHRCTQFIAQRQIQFFRHGPGALAPLRMLDAAQELGIHESTVSRTVRGKYLQCSWGIFPMGYFFSRAAAESKMSQTAAWVLLRRLIDGEDKSHPLSDQKLAEHLALEGCPLSRRTVAKYRDQMKIPSAAARRKPKK